MSPRSTARLFLTLAGLYDGLLGIAFLLDAPHLFTLCNIPAPLHWGYVHFGAALLLIFALMFFVAAAYPAGNRNLIAFGMLLKIAYIGVVLYHWLHGGVPLVFQAFLICDAVWFFVLAWTFRTVGRPVPVPASPPAP